MNIDNTSQVFLGQTEIIRIEQNGTTIWEKVVGPDYTEPFYLENTTGTNKTASFIKNNSSAPTLTIEYSIDKSTWTTLGTTSTTALDVTVSANSKVYLRCNTNTWSINVNFNNIQFDDTIGGNIMSLLYGSSFDGTETTFPGDTTHQFNQLFSGSSITNASKLLLTTTTLTEACYRGMFFGCSSLTTVPELPATTFTGIDSYRSMFRGCSSLTIAPALPATTLSIQCYYQMFYGCSSLTQAPELPATTLANYCYFDMFRYCSNLTTAPELPAPTLVDYCYTGMFRDCTSLNYIKCLATSGIDTNNSTTNWVQNVAAAGTFVETLGANWPIGNKGIPSGWTVVNN